MKNPCESQPLFCESLKLSVNQNFNELLLRMSPSRNGLTLWGIVVIIGFAIDRIFAEHPFCTTYGATLLLVAACTCRQPLWHALQMKGVSAFSKNNGAVFSWVFYVRRCSFKGSLTDTADFIIDIPRPTSNSVKSFDPDFETRGCEGTAASRRRSEICRHRGSGINGCIAGSFRHFYFARPTYDLERHTFDTLNVIFSMVWTIVVAVVISCSLFQRSGVNLDVAAMPFVEPLFSCVFQWWQIHCL